MEYVEKNNGLLRSTHKSCARPVLARQINRFLELIKTIYFIPTLLHKHPTLKVTRFSYYMEPLHI